LNLYRTRVSNTGIAQLAGLKNLSAVDLRYTRVTPTGVDSLHTALPECQIEFVAAALPATSAKPQHPRGTGQKALAGWITSLGGEAGFAGGKLKSVSLSTAPIGDAQLAALAPATGIEKLSLEATETSDLGLQHLRGLKKLRELDLSNTVVTDAGLVRLAG